MAKNAFHSFLMMALVAAAVSFGVVKITDGGSNAAGGKKSAYHHVVETNTLRCAYWLFPPLTSLNPKTNKIEGFPIDIAEEMAKRLGLKLEWVEEVTFGNMLAGLETNRYDAVCSAAIVTAARGRQAEFTVPFLYSGMVPFVRSDDHRFDENILGLNDSAYRIAAMEGDSTTDIISRQFPKAQLVSVPSFTNRMDVVLNVVSGKADVAFEEAGALAAYDRKNPGEIRLLDVEHPVRISPWALAVNKGEQDLSGMFDA
ncbi:MAG: substrate-binding periplasmic protein, partial [Bdellovibrionales bacterium]